MLTDHGLYISDLNLLTHDGFYISELEYVNISWVLYLRFRTCLRILGSVCLI